MKLKNEYVKLLFKWNKKCKGAQGWCDNDGRMGSSSIIQHRWRTDYA